MKSKLLIVHCPACGGHLSFRMPRESDVTKEKPFWDGSKICLEPECEAIFHYRAFPDGSVSIVYDPKIKSKKPKMLADSLKIQKMHDLEEAQRRN
jgi:hypothetical protein